MLPHEIEFVDALVRAAHGMPDAADYLSAVARRFAPFNDGECGDFSGREGSHIAALGNVKDGATPGLAPVSAAVTFKTNPQLSAALISDPEG